MNNTMKLSLFKTLQKELVRRNLIKYFSEKGYDNFLVSPHPPSMMDISEKIEILKGIIELSYFIEDINIENNIIKVGWNLFLLGNKRAFLGHTTHSSLTEIENGINLSKSNPGGPMTIKEIIEWSVNVLGKSEKLKDINAQNDNNALDQIENIAPNKPIPNFKRRV